jgi:predicted phage baseplate assembly protein
MPLPAPTLDNRTFEDLLAEAKSLIPRYVPAWTDYNESDPGIAMLELFSWMTEILIYRLNQVPDRNYIKFLELAGISLQPAQPARAELTFALSRPDVATVVIPKGTQVAAPDLTGAPPLVFETDESLIALGAALAAIQTFDGFAYTVQTTKNAAEGQSFFAFGPHARPGSALALGFSSPVPLPKDQFHLAVHVTEDAGGSHACGFDLATVPPPGTIQWEYWAGSGWKPLVTDKDETRSFSRSGHIYFRGPGAAAVPAKIGMVPDSLFWIRARLAAGSYDSPPQLASILTNTVRATQAQTVRDEVLGGSDGRPNQSFTLANAPVLMLDRASTVSGADGRSVSITSLRLEVDEGSGFLVWQQVEDFFASGPHDPHYTLDRASGAVAFGDGEHGRIPVANPANPDNNVVARLYRWGGGAGGNSAAGQITGLETFLDGVQSVTNLLPATGGTDNETVQQAKIRAPREIKAKDRAVTAEDFEFLAEQTPGAAIARAKAVPLMNPRFRGIPVPGAVTVVVVPRNTDPNPTPVETTLEAVCAWLNLHRLLTCELYVIATVYRKVKVQAQIVASPDADLAEVQHAVEDALTTFFHPLQGGSDGSGWPFGGAIYYSEVSRVVIGTPGVLRVVDGNLTIFLDGQQQPACRDVSICDGELLYSDLHEILVSY